MKNANFAGVVTEIPITLRLPFLGLSKFGLFSGNVFQRYFLISMLVLCMSYLIAMAQFINIKKDIFDIVRNLEELFALVQLIGKISVITYRFKDFTKLLEMTKLFWSPSICNERVKTKLNSVYNMIFQLQKLFFLVLLMAGCLLMITSLLGKTLPYGIWTLEGHEKFHRLVIIGKLIAIPFIEMFIWCSDCMYLGFCAEIVVQFNILCECLKELRAEGNRVNEEDISYLNKMKTYIQQHQLLLWFVKEFRRAFSLILFIEYITIGPLMCTELFAAFESPFYQIRARHAAVFLLLTLQMSFYCFSANYIADKALAVSDAIYFSNWYSHCFPSLKAPLTFMIQNAQNGITIKAAGVITINAQTVVNILKVAWSACSIMRRLRDN